MQCYIALNTTQVENEGYQNKIIQIEDKSKQAPDNLTPIDV